MDNIDKLLMSEDDYLLEWGNPFKALATAEAHSALAQRDHMIKVDEDFIKDIGGNLGNAKLEKIDNIWYIVANRDLKRDLLRANNGENGSAKAY